MTRRQAWGRPRVRRQEACSRKIAILSRTFDVFLLSRFPFQLLGHPRLLSLSEGIVPLKSNPLPAVHVPLCSRRTHHLKPSSHAQPLSMETTPSRNALRTTSISHLYTQSQQVLGPEHDSSVHWHTITVRQPVGEGSTRPSEGPDTQPRERPTIWTSSKTC